MIHKILVKQNTCKKKKKEKKKKQESILAIPTSSE